METRKVQLTGGSTYTVSLPKEWAHEIDLDIGDSLNLYPRGRTIVVDADDGATNWKTEIDIERRSEDEIRRAIHALYTAGFDRMTLRSKTGFDSNHAVISGGARRFIGLETIEATDSHVALKTLLDSAMISVEQSTIQSKRITLSMHEDAVAALRELDNDRANHVIERDDQVDRTYAMISRHFQRSLTSLHETEDLELDQGELYEYQTTARQLERVADHAEKIASLALRFEQPPPSDIVEEIETSAADARRIVEDATNTIIGDGETDTAHDALDRRDELTADLEEVARDLHERDVDESHLVALVLDSLMRTAEYGGNIAETGLQAAARRNRL